MYTRSKLNKTVTWILLAIALIFILSPFYFIVVNSFKPLSEDVYKRQAYMLFPL